MLQVTEGARGRGLALVAEPAEMPALNRLSPELPQADAMATLQAPATDAVKTSAVIVLAHPRDVDRLLAGPLPRRGAEWSIANLPPTEAIDRSRRLAELRGECGCGTGAACAVSALVLAVAWLVVAPMPSAMIVAGHVLAALAVVVVAGGLGKLLGITRARRLLRRELVGLRSRLVAM